MQNILDPFLLSVPDFSLTCPDEAKYHLKVMGDHQRRVQRWLLEDAGEEELEEGLFELGVEPDDFWAVAEAKITMQERASCRDVEGLDLIFRPESSGGWEGR